MRKRSLVALAAAGALLLPAPIQASPNEPVPAHPGDSCLAVSPGAATCQFTVSAETTTGVQGAIGLGTYQIVVKRGKKTFKLKGGNPDPSGTWGIAFTFKVGDKVTASVLSTPGWILAGHI